MLLKNKHYFTESFIFPSPVDVSVAIAAPAAKRRTYPPACCHPSHMHLCRPDPRCLCHLQCRDHSSLAMAIPPSAAAPFCCQCQLQFSHSCCCQPLLVFTALINGWLLPPSLLCHPLPDLLSATPIIDNFFAGRRAILFLIYAVLFLMAPLPLSTVVIYPATALNLASCRVPLVLWCSCLSSILAGFCIASHHAATFCLPASLPAILPLPLVVRHDWLLRCRLHLPCATVSRPPVPPPLFICCLLLLTSFVPCD